MISSLKEKKEIIDLYYNNRRLNIDIFSDTYRGGMDDNLFIPFSFFDIKKEWINHLNEEQKPIIDFYIHIPFCLSICKFCDYYKEVPNKESIGNYLEYLYNYLNEYKEIFKGYTFRGLYIGGGTPSMLSLKQIDDLLLYIFENFKFSENGEKTFEVNPININNAKMKIIAKYGINRISMGVQSLDPDVLKKANRDYQGEKVVSNAINIIKKHGINDISLDVVMGLKEDNLVNIILTLRKIYSFNPSNIILYWLLPTDTYLDEHFKGNLELFYDESFKKIELYHKYLSKNIDKIGKFDEIKIDKNNGYRWDLTIKKFDIEKYDDFSSASLFGVGASARSHIFGKIYYETISDLNLKYNTNFDVKSFGKNIDIKDEISLYSIINIMNTGIIKLPDFKNIFALDFEEIYEKELDYFYKKNKAEKISNKEIKFYLHYKEKNYYALFFLFNEKLYDKKYIFNNKNKIYLKFKNGLELSILFKIENSKISYILNNHNSFTIDNLFYYYKICKNLDKIIISLSIDNNDLLYIIKKIIYILGTKYKNNLKIIGI
ncbi:MAG: radical SAM protein [Candidatus Gracilibacteria bacterium]